MVRRPGRAELVRLVALVQSADHVCCRYRVSAFRPAFARAGYTLDVTPMPRSWAGCIRLFRSLRTADAVLLQRSLPPPYLTAALRRHARHLVFDFDDAVWLRDSYAPKGFVSRKRAARFQAIIAAADHVVAGNRYLAGRVAGVPVTVIPTCVDPAQYPVAAHATPGVTLAWVGSQSTLRGLDRFRPTLEEIGRAVPGARLRVVSDATLALDHLPVEFVPWSSAGEVAALAGADVGVAWVPDDPWSRGKCGLKVIQYQAAGLPVVANPVGVQAKLVRGGRTGYLATTADEWVAAVRKLAADPALRRRLGAAGRQQVEAAYSVAAAAEARADVLAGARPVLAAAG
jgi:glycosyltransferase involved in cell wall biosynthesis